MEPMVWVLEAVKVVGSKVLTGGLVELERVIMPVRDRRGTVIVK